MTSNSDNKSFLKSLFSVSLPVVLQELLRNSLSFTDTVMIGRLGEVPIASVGLGNQLYFFIFVVLYGITSGCSIFSSQYWGSKNKEGVQKTMGLSLVVSTSVALVFAVVTTVFPHSVLRLFTSDTTVIETGCLYLRIVGISYIFVSISESFSVTLRATGDTKRPMFITFFSMVMNLVGNYILIFRFKMGVRGAALATSISRLFEALALTFIIYKKSPVRPDKKLMFPVQRVFAKKVFNTAFPVILDDTFWAFGLSVYKVVFARMGVEVLACTNISDSIQNLFFTLQNGFGAGIAILIGQQIGRKNYEKAQEDAGIGLKFTFAIGVLSGLLMLCCCNILPKFFNVSETVGLMIRNSIIVLSLTLPVKFINHAFVCGIGRSGGDTKFIFYIELVSVWVFGVPAAIVSGFVLFLSVWWVYAAIFLEDLSKYIVFIRRFKSKKWLNDLVN